MMRKADRPEDALMLGVAKVLDEQLTSLGKAAVREIVTFTNQLGVLPDHLPYLFWALATDSGLPSLGSKEKAAFDTMVTILDRTDTMPKYSSAFSLVDDLTTDAAVDATTRHMGSWALKTMYPGLLKSYQMALQSQVKKVPKATDRQVPKGREFDFLRKTFRQVLSLRSRMFRDGELLRRVVRLLPI